jgi:hypothetical protein
MKNWIKVTAIVATLLPLYAMTLDVRQPKQADKPTLMASDPSNPLPKPTGKPTGGRNG